MTIIRLGKEHFEFVRDLSHEFDLGEKTPNSYEMILRTAFYYNLGCVFEGKVIGYLISRLITTNTRSFNNFEPVGEAELHEIAVEEEFQNLEIGTLLLEKLLEHCGKLNIREIWLEVRESNKKAIDFYSKNNFDVVYKRKNYYRNPPESALLMKLNFWKI